MQLADTDWVGFSSSFPWSGLISQECPRVPLAWAVQMQSPGAQGPQLPQEHPFPPFLGNPKKTVKPVHLTQSRHINICCVCHKGGLLISPLTQTHTKSYWRGEVRQKKQITVGCCYSHTGKKHFHCTAVCTKTNKTDCWRGTMPLLVWREVLCWRGTMEELGASYSVLFAPLGAEQAFSMSGRVTLFSFGFCLQ